MRGAVTHLRSNVVGLLVLLALFGAPYPVCAQSAAQEPETVPPPLLSLGQLDAYLEFRGDYTYREVRTPNRLRPQRDRKQRNREWTLEERIGLKLSGTLVDPGFITFHGDFSFALTQDRFKEDTQSRNLTDRDNGSLLLYDLRMNFFQGKKLSGSVYGLRQQDRINRRFQPTLDQRRTGFGTSWVLTHQTIRTELSYDYLETDRTGNVDPLDDEHFTESTLRYRADWLISEHQRLNFSYEHANIKQEYQGSARPFETTRDLFIIDHQLALGTEHQHALRTRVHWQEESGDFARDFFEIGPQLTLKHSDNLETIYEYQFNRERFEGLDVETQRLDFQLVHQIYSNLTTTLDVFGLFEDVENDVNTTQYGASVDWQYNRRNRLGHLYANLALAYDTEEVDGDSGERIILNEAHTFRDPVSVILRNRNAIVTTIVVTDTANRRVFQHGLDYSIFRQGNATRLRRIRTGRIADGDSVLVDYLIKTPTRGQLDTVRVDFSLEQRFSNGWTPYYRLAYRNQEDDISTGFLLRADRTNHHRLGFNYEAKRYSFGAEFEIFDDTVDPYDAFHVNGLWHAVQAGDHTLDASARFSQLFFEGGVDDRDVSLLDVELDHRRRLTESVSTFERLAYRFEDDSIDGITHSWDVRAGLEYVVGDFTGELTLEYDRLELGRSKEDNFGIFVRIRREFPDVLARK